MWLWLDDTRQPPSDDWHWVRTGEEAIVWLADDIVEKASLDHDLGDHRMTGYDVVCWLEAHPEHLPWNGIEVHSMNPVGANRMIFVLDRLYNRE